MIETNNDKDFCTSARPSTRESYRDFNVVPENGWVYANVREDAIVVCAETDSSDTCEVPLTHEEAREFAAWLLKVTEP